MYEQPPEAIAQPWVDEAGGACDTASIEARKQKDALFGVWFNHQGFKFEESCFLGEKLQALAVFQSHGHDHVETQHRQTRLSCAVQCSYSRDELMT